MGGQMTPEADVEGRLLEEDCNPGIDWRCAPVTPLYCGLLFLAMYDASCSVGLLYKTYAADPTQPISFATTAPQAAALPSSASLELDFFQFLCNPSS